MRRFRLTSLGALGLTALALGVAVLAVWRSGSFLIVDRPGKADVIVVTQSSSLDQGYWAGLRLLNDGYGRELLVDARINEVFFGRAQAEWARDFIRTTAGENVRVRVCPITASSTVGEVFDVEKCLEQHPFRSVLLVVSDFHSRRSLSTFTQLLPRYVWSIAAVPEPSRFGSRWWRKREWARTALIEWEHLLWWEFVDRWMRAESVKRIR